MPHAPALADVPGQPPADQTVVRKKRGFAAMNPDLQRRIASQGGKAAHISGNAHEFSKEEARAAGAKKGKLGRRTQP